MQAISSNKRNNEFCTAHYFTSYPMSENVLGLAWIANARLDMNAGICSMCKYKHLYCAVMYFNCTTKSVNALIQYSDHFPVKFAIGYIITPPSSKTKANGQNISGVILFCIHNEINTLSGVARDLWCLISSSEAFSTLTSSNKHA
jgi:hypothetical protein